MGDNKEGIISAAISGATQIGGGLISAFMQKKENARQRDYEREMYQRNLDDNLAFWKMSNEYNSPHMQMERLKAAGLNPNLAYGNGATATVENAKVPTPSTSNSTRTGVDADTFSLAPAMSAYYNTMVQKGQANLLEQQALTQQSNRELNAATAHLRLLQAAKQSTDNKVARATIDTQIKQVVANLTKTQSQISNIDTDTGLKTTQQRFNIANTQRTIDENKRAWQSQQISLKQMLQNIVESQSRTELNQSQMGLNRANTDMAKVKTLIDRIDYEYKSGGYNRNPNASGLNKVIDTAVEGMSKGGSWAIDKLHDLLMYLQGYRKQ